MQRSLDNHKLEYFLGSNYREILRRALKTFLQTAFAVLAVAPHYGLSAWSAPLTAGLAGMFSFLSNTLSDD